MSDETTFYIKQGDTLPPLIETLFDEEAKPFDFTNATEVKLHIKKGSALLVNAVAEVVGDPEDGKVRYDWVEEDTADAGVCFREWQVTMASGEKITVPNTAPSVAFGKYKVVIAPQLA